MATTKKKKRFAKPGCGFRAINYRDRLGRFARQKVSDYLGYIEGKREGGCRYIPDVLKVLWDLVELDKFVGPSPRGQHRLGVDLLRTLPLYPKTASRESNLRFRRVLAQPYRIFGIWSPWILGKAVKSTLSCFSIENFISIADGPSSFHRQRRNLELEQGELWTELSSCRSRFFGEQEVARVTRGTR